MAIDSIQGVTVGFDSAGGDAWFTDKVISVSWSGITREAHPTSHAGQAIGSGKTYLPGDLYDPGECTIEFFFEGDDVPLFDTSSKVAESLTITLPDGNIWEANGFMTSFEWSGTGGESADVMTGTVVIKLTGDISDPNIN